MTPQSDFFNVVPDTFEQQYLDLLERIIDTGTRVMDRTGTGTIAVFDAKLTCAVDEFPFSTIRRANPRLAFEEFWFFLNGKTQTQELEAKGVHFWHDNTTREFLDKRGLYGLPVGDMGAAYGSQLRAFGKSSIMAVQARDQLAQTISTLKDDRYSRRIYNTMWNPNESHLMALTPCWHSHQFVVLPDADGNDVLHLKIINRSLDTLFGATFAVQQYRMYQIALANMLQMRVGEMSCDLTHVHLYDNQIEYAKELLTRGFCYNANSTYSIKRVQLERNINTLNDLIGLTWKDWSITLPDVNITPFTAPRPPMAA